MKKLNIALIGYGRSGRDIHSVYYNRDSNIYYNVAYVVDMDSDRRALAKSEFSDAEILSDYTELFSKNDIDLVVNATYSDNHYSVAKDLLEHGFNVLIEKPFARNFFEANNLINIAKKNGCVLSVFQQSLFNPIFLKSLEVIESGIIGDFKQATIKYNGFARRWDWQTMQVRLGGSVYNTGPHPIGMAMAYLGFENNIEVAYSNLDRFLTSGDAEDYAKIILTCGNKIADIEINSIDAFPNDYIKIQGSKGTFRCNQHDYEIKYIVDGENKEKTCQYYTLKGKENKPIYCGENLITHTENDTCPGDAFGYGTDVFYENLYFEITEGSVKNAKPEYIAKLIGIIEKVHAENPLSVKYTAE